MPPNTTNLPSSEAYHNADWAEFYDLMVKDLFGNQPSQDAAIFFRVLQGILPHVSKERTITILDIGAGTGRVILQMLDSIVKGRAHFDEVGASNLSFSFIAEDNGQAMLDRARKIIEPLRDHGVQRSSLPLGDDPPVNFTLNTVCDSAAELGVRSPNILESGSVHLALFAAGGLTHITEDGGVSSFLARLNLVLNSQGRAVISILKEFLKGGGGVAGTATGEGVAEKKEGVYKLASVERNGEVYAKYPTECVWRGDFRTDKFKLDVEDGNGNVLRSSELKWDVKFIAADEWEDLVQDAGFDIEDKVDGDIQVWWILKKRG